MKTEEKSTVQDSWVEVGEDGAEHVFYRCRHCGQPKQSERKVLRVSDEDYEKLKELDDLAFRGSWWVAAANSTSFIMIIFAALYLVLLAPKNDTMSVLAVVSVLFLCAGTLSFASFRWHSRNGEKRRTVRREVLSRYGAKIEDYPLILPPKSVDD